MNANGQPMPRKPGPPGPQATEQPDQDENHPAFKAALEFAMTALYDKKAAVDVAKSLRLAQNPAEEMANIAYEITSIADEKSNGQVPPDLLVMLASRVLEEVATITEAAGIPVKGSVIAQAIKTMILRYLGENGANTAELQAAMDQVNTEEFDKTGGLAWEMA